MKSTDQGTTFSEDDIAMIQAICENTQCREWMLKIADYPLNLRLNCIKDFIQELTKTTEDEKILAGLSRLHDPAVFSGALKCISEIQK